MTVALSYLVQNLDRDPSASIPRPRSLHAVSIEGGSPFLGVPNRMAAESSRVARSARPDERRKWLLLALCAFAAVVIAATVADNFGFGGTPWYGWWDSFRVPSTEPYSIQFGTPREGGATQRAGVHVGDRADAREQSFAERVVLFSQPIPTQPVTFVLHRGEATIHATITGSTWSQSASFLKLLGTIPSILASAWFLGCALLIAIRRSSLSEARTLALVLLCLVPGYFTTIVVVPNATMNLVVSAASQAYDLLALGLLVSLTSRFGSRAPWRRAVEGLAYLTIAVDVLRHVAFYIGVVTLRIDPVRFWAGALGAGKDDLAATLVVSLAAVSAVIATSAVLRPRTAWLLLPLPTALLVDVGCSYVGPFAATWVSEMALEAIGLTFLLIGALTVTYALLRRRVLDFEFVLSRTLVVGMVSLIIVAAFVLLEWILGTTVAGASHATGLIANGALALVLGLSLRYVHRRADAFVDAVLFRKRHEDERALLDFSKEAAYVTDFDALLNQAIAIIRDHTDARSAAVLIDSAGAYRPARSFGDGVFAVVGENDPAILALKTWHKPIDPQHWTSDLHGALAFPMLARGRMLGVVLLGERAGGEAYAPDDIEALSQVAHGVGTALDALSAGATESIGALRASIAALSAHIAVLGEKIDLLSMNPVEEH